MTVLKTSFWVLVFSLTCLFTYHLPAQSIPDIPFDIDFAGVTVHLNEQSRAQLQREVGQLYANRSGLQRDIESLRQLTPLLEPILKAEQLPLDYRYAALPFAGDALTGYWGLTNTRALSLSMVINNAVDERYHPTLATEMVASHLGRLHKTSDNYALTLLRYIQSDTLTKRLADNVNSTYLVLDTQSPALMWKIIARKLAFEREEPVFRPVQTYVLYETRYRAGSSLRTISRQLQLDEDRFKPFNTWLKAGVISNTKDYPVLVRVTVDEFPVVKSRDNARSKVSVPGQGDVGFPTLIKLPQSTVSVYKSAVYYRINDYLGVQAQPCASPITLAYYGKMRVKKFLSYNELTERDVIQPGQIYYLEQKAKRAKVPFHIVQKNQTLREIANVYGVRLKSLLKFNRVQPTQRVQAGRIVWLQKKRPQNQPVEYRQLPVEQVKPEVEDMPTVALSTPADSSTRQPDSLRRQTDSLARPVVATAPVAATVTTVPVKPVETALPDKKLPEAVVEKKEVVAEKKVTPVPPAEPTSKLTQTPKLHVVKSKDTYYHISQVYRISLSQLYAWNKLSERIPLEIGQKLIVGMTKIKQPVAVAPVVAKPAPQVAQQPKPVTAVIPPTAKTPTAEPAEKVIYHVVKPGQTVYRVALINKVSVPDLMRWNNLKNYTIEVGQKLIIRKGK